ncbi:MAG: FAD-dependent oxidoreductase, partial [Turicibacter sp.]
QAFQQDNQATVLVYEQDMMIKELTSEAFLVATGRRPDVKALNLENGKIEVNERGFINVSETLQTSNSSVWALGDVTGGPQFTYISLDDYRIIQDQLFGEKKRTTKNRPVYPTVLFLDPAYARVGLNVSEAKEKGFKVQVAKMPVAAIPRAKQIGKTEGFLKIVIDSNTSKILGASLLAHASSELIHLIQMAIDLGLPYTYLRDQIYAHPTMAEAFNELLAPSLIKSV